ncbi:hypothetical protein FA13DRAFT_1642259 [Coprinellus micaceus]|uniref:WD40 repeat-like protein n=1 Tax=Coprinellus micaceus TaxID=71717 RepID=A0A4Y7SJ69_COPMI|nr:hypothetical protein FA13DRAFT_1642259 [Coprinellus micaceus]
MPRDLPGFYWDAERNRYFPLSSRPPGFPPSGPSTQQAEENPPKKRKLQNRTTKHPKVSQKRMPSDEEDSDEESAENRTKTSPAPGGRRTTHVCLQSCCIGGSSRLTYNQAPIFGKITTFCVSPQAPDGESGRWHLLGDSRGWLFRCKASYRDRDTEDPAPPDSDIDAELNWLPWSAELNLQPNGCVSSISMWGSRWVATGAGSSARFASSDIRSLDRMFIVTLPGARDLWASHLHERSVAFGASFRAIYVPDIDHSTAPEQLNTHSDIFTNLVYTGARNGSIHRFDKRVGFKGRGDILLDSRFPTDQRSSVLSLSLLGAARDDPAHSNSALQGTVNSGLLVSHMNGQLQTFDLRYVSTKASRRASEPIVVYNGHVNTHTRELGLAIDHTTGFLYAAGQDCRIRGWALSTGEPISTAPGAANASRSGTLPTPQDPWSHTHPFHTTFAEPIPVLRVSSDDTGVEGRGGRRLWAAAGEGLWRWNLG